MPDMSQATCKVLRILWWNIIGQAPAPCLFVLHVRYKAICDLTHFSTLTSISLLATCGDQDRERQAARQMAETTQKNQGARIGILQKGSQPALPIQLADFNIKINFEHLHTEWQNCPLWYENMSPSLYSAVQEACWVRLMKMGSMGKPLEVVPDKDPFPKQIDLLHQYPTRGGGVGNSHQNLLYIICSLLYGVILR